MSLRSMKVSIGRFSVKALSSVHESFHCLLCSKVLKDPRQAPCGCRFCLDCIDNYLGGDARFCPGKTEDCLEVKLDLEKNLRLDVLAKREINKITVKCCFPQCDKKCEVKDMQDHLVDCASTRLQCQMCHETVIRSEYEAHASNNCKEAIVSCEWCNETMERKRMNNEHHKYEHSQLCPAYSDLCPNDCGETGRVVWKKHQMTCKVKCLPCPYQAIGCTTSDLAPRHMSQHMVDKGFEHGEVLLKHVENLNNEIACINNALETVTKDITTIEENQKKEAIKAQRKNSKDSAISANMEGMQKDIMRAVEMKIAMSIKAAMRECNFGQSLEISRMKTNIETMKQEIESLKRKEDSLVSKKLLDDDILPFLDDNEDTKETKRNNKDLTTDKKYKKDVLAWPLSNFTQIHYRGSPTFYSHPRGYKLSLLVEKVVKGYMSIYVRLHSGENDNDLSWPFRKSVIIRILDKENLGRDYERTVLFNSKAGLAGERKYLSETGDFGYSKFISYIELRDKAYLIKNDLMCIHCVVEELDA